MPSESVDSLKRGGIWFLPAGSRLQVEIVGDVNAMIDCLVGNNSYITASGAPSSEGRVA